MSAAPTLEREAELDRIAALLDAAAAGGGATLVIEGPAGIGKTRLVQDARALAKLRGFGRLHAAGDELDSAIAWSVLRQMAERSLWGQPEEARAKLLAGAAGIALAALDAAPGDATAGDAAVARTLHALWWIVVDLAASRPLLISVDDAQWSDPPSLRFFAYLSRRIADLPIALVIAARPPPDGSGPLAELSGGAMGERLFPRPLSREAVAELAGCDGVPGAAAAIAAVHGASGGNPLFARVLLDELGARGLALEHPRTAAVVSGLGPTAIARAVLARLPADAVALAGAAAVIGVRSDRWLAAAIAELRGERLAVAMDALVTEHVVIEDRGKLVFVHPVVREALHVQLGPGGRAALHAKATLALVESGASVQRVAAHLAYAPKGTLTGAAALLRESGAALLADGDAANAAKHLNRALEDAPRDREIEAELGFALLRAGEAERARTHLRAAAEAAPGERERAERLAAAAQATSLVEGPAAAVGELRALLEAWPQTGREPARLVLEARLAAICALLPAESRAIAERLRAFADLPGATRDERALLGLLAQRERYDVRPAADVAAIVARALGEGAYLDDVADGADGMVAWIVAMMALIGADGIELATAELARARAKVRERGSPLEFGIVSNVAAAIAWRTGDIAATEAEAETSLAAVAAEDDSATVLAVRATATYCAVWAAIERGDAAAAAAALAPFDEPAAGGLKLIPLTWLRAARALLALECDAPDRARAEALALGAEMRAAHMDTPTVSWRPTAALAALRLGDEAAARTLADEQLELARRWGTATEIGGALRLSAHVDAERRFELLGEAIGVLEHSPARLELARALVDLGQALRVARRRAEAHDPLHRGAELAAACGSHALRERALEGLAALGDRPRKLMFSGEESLTASERRVAQLAGAGRTNRDIAQELFVSPKTIENHLGRVYVKLGITSRRQLANLLD